MIEKQYNKSALKIGSTLQSFQIKRILGTGGFGITYLAEDMNLKRYIAIKEYFPQEIAIREGDTTVSPKSNQHEPPYTVGVEKFLKEAQSLAQFTHPNIIRILNFFSANGTAYFVMEYLPGWSLGDYLKNSQKPISEQVLMKILFPILKGLNAVHEKGILHRDIKPDNIYLRKDGEPLLIDFGASRYAMGQASRSLSMVLTEGYAPFEQYRSDSGNQGPWTDLYALGATLYTCITCKVPLNAPDRVSIDGDADPLIPAIIAGKGKYNDCLLQAIDNCLAVATKNRPQSVDEFQAMLRGIDSEEPKKIRLDQYRKAFKMVWRRDRKISVETRRDLKLCQEKLELTDAEVLKIENEFGEKSKKSSKSKLTYLYVIIVVLIIAIAAVVTKTPKQPELYNQVLKDNGTIELRWIERTESFVYSKGFWVERLTNDEEFEPIEKLERGISEYTDEDISFGNTYTYRIQAIGTYNSSEFIYSDEIKCNIAIVSQETDGDFRNIGEAVKAAWSGCKILVRPGVYNEGIKITKQVEILGDGSRDKIVIKSDYKHCIYMATDHATVRNLTLNYIGGGSNYFSVDIPRGSLHLENCDITSNSTACIVIRGEKANPTIKNCKIHKGEGYGVYIGDNGKGRIEKCKIYGNAYANIGIRGGGNPTIVDCQIYKGKQNGIDIYDNGKGRIEKCKIYENAYANIVIRGGGNPTILECKIYKSKSNGIYITDYGRGRIEKCKIFENKSNGIEITKRGHPTIIECEIYYGKSNGISVTDNGRGRIEKCEIYANSSDGIEISEWGNPMISNCDIHNGGEDGIYITNNGRARIKQCKIHENKLNGILISSKGNTIVLYCEIYDNKKYGIRAGSESQGQIMNCKLWGNEDGAWNIDSPSLFHFENNIPELQQ